MYPCDILYMGGQYIEVLSLNITIQYSGLNLETHPGL